MEKIYYPYPAKDGTHKYYIITKSGKKYILELLIILILQYTGMKKERTDILKGIRIEKIGQNQELTQLVGGRKGIYGIYQPKKS